MFEQWGRRWECVRGCDVVDPDEWFLELRDITEDPNGQIVLIARWPADGNLSIKSYREDVTTEMIEWFTATSKIAIPPIHPENAANDEATRR